MTVSREDLEFFDQNGYVVLRHVVPENLLTPVIDAIWRFLEMDPDTPDTWYRGGPRVGALVEMHQHQALWDTRQYPAVHEAFAAILGTEKLWVSMDRCGMKPPRNLKYPEFDDPGFIHWDIDTSVLSQHDFGVQGVLYLTDTTEDMGGFQCVPGFHRNLAEWIAEQPTDCDPYYPDLSRLPAGMSVERVAGNAGDLIIWSHFLAHGNGHNVSDRPRLAQYIKMRPAQDDEAERQERVACWREHRPPAPWLGDPGKREQLHGVTAELTPLGRKLLGLDRW